jgi:hypothetical protein
MSMPQRGGADDPTSPHLRIGGFGPEFDRTTRARIDAVLRRIAVGQAAGEWDRRPDRIDIGQRYDDGLSGALVVAFQATSSRGSAWYVAKISTYEETREEWDAYLLVRGGPPNSLCLPIVAVTQGVLDRDEQGEDEAVICAEAGQFSSLAGSPQSLEQAVRAALSGAPDESAAVAVAVGTLFSAAQRVFYGKPHPDRRSRMDAKDSLGPDLRVRIDLVTPDRSLLCGCAAEAAERTARYPDEVVDAGLALSGAEADGPPSLPPVGHVELMLAKLRQDGERWLAVRDQSTIEITAADPAVLSSLAPGKVTRLRGNVLDTRSGSTWEHACAVLAGLEVRAPGVIVHAGVATAHPFTALRQVLRDEDQQTWISATHGDLNARNVLLVSGVPYLIDFARGLKGAAVPVLRDPAWLELNLLRRPLSEELGYADLIRLQRLLLFGDRVATLLPAKHAAVGQTLVDLAGRDRPAGRAMRVLVALRRGAQGIVDAAGGESWWRDYQRELLIAAHRAMKWRERDPALWHAHFAAAAVACEALTDQFALWPDQELADAATRLLPLLPDTPQSAPLLGEVTAALHSRATLMAEDPVRHAVRAARARLGASTARLSPVAAHRARELSYEHDRYMDLSAVVSTDPRSGAAESAPGAASAVLRWNETVVLGLSGSGKTALLQEVEYRLLDAVLRPGPDELEKSPALDGRLPVIVSAAEIAESGDRIVPLVMERLRSCFPADPAGLLTAAAVHLLVDDLHLVPAETVPQVCRRLREFRHLHPGIPVTVAVRGSAPPDELAGWTAVALRGPSLAQGVRYLAYSWRGLAMDMVLVMRHVDAAVTATTGIYGEAGQSPQRLAMLADLGPDALADRATPSHGDVLEVYLSRRLDRVTVADAREAVERRAQELARALTIGSASVLPEQAPDADLVLNENGLLAADGRGPRFSRPDVQDYFAARWLLRTMPEGGSPHPLALDHSWRDAWMMLLSLSSTPRRLREQVLNLAVDADPGFAARLLAACPARLRPRRIAELFVTQQLQTLRDRAQSPAAHEEAAAALAATRAPAGYSQLLLFLSAESAAPKARALALRALADGCTGASDEPQNMQLRDRVAVACAAILTEDAPADVLLATALETVERLHLDRLALQVSAWLRGQRSWTIRATAMRVLTALGVPLPGPTQRDVQLAARDALADLEAEMRAGRTGPADPGRARLELLAAHSAAERLPLLLARRAAFGIGEMAADLIDAEIAADNDLQGPWAAILRGHASRPELLRAVVSDDPPLAGAGLHAVLKTGGRGAAEAFGAVAAQGPPHRAAVLAALIRRLPAAHLPEAVDLARDVLATLARDPSADLEGAACLVQAAFIRDPVEGFRLARQTHSALAELERRDRFRWPWPTALVRCTITLAGLDRMLSSPEPRDRDLATDALGDHLFLALALPGPGQEHSFGDGARDHLMALLRDPAEGNALRTVRAAAAVGIAEALPSAMAIADSGAGGEPETVRSGPALVEAAPVADAFAAAGYLARNVAAEQGERVHAWLAERDTSSLHPSVEAGRLIGLAFLGDWEPLFGAVAAGRPDCSEAAHNVLDHWLPDDRQVHGQVALWVSARLREGAASRDVRDTLFRMRQHAERLYGRATPRGRSA